MPGLPYQHPHFLGRKLRVGADGMMMPGGCRQKPARLTIPSGDTSAFFWRDNAAPFSANGNDDARIAVSCCVVFVLRVHIEIADLLDLFDHPV